MTRRKHGLGCLASLIQCGPPNSERGITELKMVVNRCNMINVAQFTAKELSKKIFSKDLKFSLKILDLLEGAMTRFYLIPL